MLEASRRFRHAARALLPPIVVRWLRPAPPAALSFSGAFRSYEEAAQAAASSGYQDPVSISRTLATTADYRARLRRAPEMVPESRVMQALAAFLFAIDKPHAQPIRVLDFGGGVGLHFFCLAPLLARRWKVEWTICELPALTRAGADLYGDQIKFVSTLDDVRNEHFDVALASGSLQYAAEPLVVCDTLLNLCDALIVNRTPFIDSATDRLTVQQVRFSTGLVSYPAWFLSRERWFLNVAQRGFKIELAWPSPEDCVTLDHQLITYSGLLACRATDR